ncbi:hypothetical protein Glove_658g3 [Diversispora epigaea]|uniref:Protein kinase domain-containing protein n=1 Tax=Diversispora epigaea TaxID=1348612 RepID=A0A397G8N7_9GLOM|nr:hypothetical protein Glove_658g3 [Diversispora epigaea]
MSISNSKKELKLLQYASKNRLIKTFDYNTFEDIKLIANRAFGQVERAYAKNLQKNVALKSFHEINKNIEFSENFLRECINNNAINNHDNIVKFLGVSTDHLKEKHYFIFQYAEDGDLRTYLRMNFNKLNWKTKINMAKDITKGLRYIHQANIVHRDLHSKNILVHEGKLMISDLGLSKSLDTDSRFEEGGMYAYTDPKYLKNMKTYKRNKPSDIYSLGVLFWEISSGKPPFKNIPSLEIYKEVTSGSGEKPVQGTPVDYINIYSNAWKDDPNQRPTIEDIHNSLENIKLEILYDHSNENNQSKVSINSISMDNYRDRVSISSTSVSLKDNKSLISNNTISINNYSAHNNYNENNQSQISINNNISMDNYRDSVSILSTSERIRMEYDSNGNDSDSTKGGETNDHILISSQVNANISDVNSPHAFQNFKISASLWAKVDPLPNKRNDLKFSINVGDCRAGPMLSDNWPLLRKLGIGYFLDSVEIWITPISKTSISDKFLYILKDKDPPNLNKDIDITKTKVHENNHGIESSISGINVDCGIRNKQYFTSTTKEWELLDDGCGKNVLGWRYQYIANSLFKDLNHRRNFAPGEHYCHITSEVMSGFRITITQVLRCEITEGWRKYKLNTRSKLKKLCPKMAHTLEISFNSLENFDENFANLKNSENSEKLRGDFLNVTFAKNATPQIEDSKNFHIGNIEIRRSFRNLDQQNIPKVPFISASEPENKNFANLKNSEKHQHDIPKLPSISADQPKIGELSNTDIKSSVNENKLKSVSKHNYDIEHEVHEITEIPPNY